MVSSKKRFPYGDYLGCVFFVEALEGRAGQMLGESEFFVCGLQIQYAWQY